MDAFAHQSSLICGSCAQDFYNRMGVNTAWSDDPDVCPQGPHSDGGGEADAPQHCGRCHEFLENPLTTDGADHLRAFFRSCVTNDQQPTPHFMTWWDFYDHLRPEGVQLRGMVTGPCTGPRTSPDLYKSPAVGPRTGSARRALDI